MFDKTKARIEKLEETNETFRSVKQHIEDYQVVYASIGASMVTAIVLKTTMKPQIITVTNAVNPVISPEMNNTINHIVVQALGDPGNIVQCLETGTIYASQGQAARELGISLSRLSQHVNGLQEAVNGLHFEKLGKAGHPLA